jgi:hypothetical protein
VPPKYSNASNLIHLVSLPYRFRTGHGSPSSSPAHSSESVNTKALWEDSNGPTTRRLVALQTGVEFCHDFVSKENVISLQEDIQVVRVRASSTEIANNLARRLFAIFNWNDADEKMVDLWQTKLLKRQV